MVAGVASIRAGSPWNAGGSCSPWAGATSVALRSRQGLELTIRGVLIVGPHEITGAPRSLDFRGSRCCSITGDSARYRRMFGIGSEQNLVCGTH